MNKKKYRDMEYSVKKCVAWLGYAFLAAGLSTSCDMMHDETDDCPTGLYLSFKYDYNLQRADMFNDHVGAVSVYVFDETGHYVTCREVKNEGDYRPALCHAHGPGTGALPISGIGRAMLL